ncbi:DNA mismatch repair endonuclease MutL [Anaerotignum sp.]|nr:DNA mismatch repair endonuclease MutL [Anaerotignum sp.]MBQ7757833.1 DNA mismatch repair endonuclease MutL [Anaerotignum sp.]
MQKIRLLDSKTINKIAAGEVVESPKSVVKELTENAIDAGASSVTVEIKEGGISYIRVADNGSGIPKEQVKSAFLRHATSKMSQIEDLEHIFTLGFRGEALASIAAVAQVEMLTKTRDEETGTRICINAGEIEVMEDTACREGTSITVKNLFYNVPARRKFLKKPATESGYVSDLVNKIALGHPEVAIQYINNGTTVLHTAGNNDPKTAVFYVYGKDAANNMLPISYKKGEYAVSGLIGKPELCRANRNYENLFINGRFIKNQVVSSAVEDAYKTKLIIGKFPVFVLNLEVEPALVDVNVHPAKLEVRFKNDDEVYEFFYTAVSKALQETVLIPKAVLEKDKKPKEKQPEPEQQTLADNFKKEEIPAKPAEKVVDKPAEKPAEHPKFESVILPKAELPGTEAPKVEERPSAPVPAGGRSVDELLKRKPSASGVAQKAEPYLKKEAVQEKKVELPKAEPVQPKVEPVQKVEPPVNVKPEQGEIPVAKEKIKEEKKPFFHNYKIIGQVFRTYWIVEQGECLYLIDQHAAHERILYEELMNKFKEEHVVSQRMLTPLMLNLTPSEVETLKDNKELLESFGFELEDFGGKFALRSTPYLLQNPSSVGFFTEILDRLAEERITNVYDTKILAVATMACKAAVKGHDVLSVREAEALIHQLLKLEHPFTCPHGRPTIIELTRYEMEKMFKRIQN